MKHYILFTITLLMAACCLCATACKGKTSNKSTESQSSNAVVRVEAKNLSVGDPFLDFTIVQDESKPQSSTVRLSDYVGKGKYVLVDFWASWCGPCMREIPNIRAVYEKFGGERFDVLSVACWDEPQDSREAIEKMNMTWSHIINAQKIATDVYGIKGIPHLILFDPEGKVVAINLRGEKIAEAVAKALSK